MDILCLLSKLTENLTDGEGISKFFQKFKIRF
jgi:hypothetical protein